MPAMIYIAVSTGYMKGNTYMLSHGARGTISARGPDMRLEAEPRAPGRPEL